MNRLKKLTKTIDNYLNNCRYNIKMETVTIPKQEYKLLKHKAELDEDLLISLVKGLEEIKAGKIKPWKKLVTN